MANALFIRSVLDRRSCWGSCVEFIEALIHTGHGCFILMAGGPIGDESQRYSHTSFLPVEKVALYSSWESFEPCKCVTLLQHWGQTLIHVCLINITVFTLVK